MLATSGGFQHVTALPRYPQLNGKAENAVRTIKSLFDKCATSGQSEVLALLDWRNTPTEGMTTSPAQRLMGRRCRTLLPASNELFHPRYAIKEEQAEIEKNKARQEQQYNKYTRPLGPLVSGYAVYMKLPGEKLWTKGVCITNAGPRSYTVLVNGMTYRRNRRQLSTALPEASECELEQTAGQDEEQEQPTNHLPDNRHDDTELLPLGRHTGTQSAADFESTTAVSQPRENTLEVTKPSGEPPLRCSEHLRKKPERYGQS